ncbi:MAG: homocysteine S-methyltransferase family protein [Planctomycetota bacterium]
MDRLNKTLLIGSGSIRTVLRERSAPGVPVELLNLREPGAVRALHAAYREAGSDILVTNSFAANPLVLEEAGAPGACAAVNRAGVALAREAATGTCLVWGLVGPLGLGLRIEDYSDAALAGIYGEQCQALAGADALLLETFSEPREARAALATAAATGRPVIFQVGNTGAGPKRWERIDALLDLARQAGAVAVGVNCLHPDEIMRAAAYIAGRYDLPLSVAPNAGNPRIERGLVRYEFQPEAPAVVGERLAGLGAAVVGGCCGTTPDHIRRLAAALKGRAVVARPRARAAARREGNATGTTLRQANPVRALMEGNAFVVSVEIRADRMRPLAEVVTGASEVAAAGADLFDVPDNPGATVGRDAMVTAARLQQDLGVPSISHQTVTQSNLLRLHAALIGGWDLGLRGILAITGDAPSMGPLADLAHRVTDLKSSVELLRLIRRLREGEIANGEKLADPPDYCAGCALGRGTPAQLQWLAKKIDAGAEFAFSQPVFLFDDYCRLRDAAAGCGIRFFPGLMPLVSRRSAEFLAGGRIPGIVVPAEVAAAFARFEQAADQWHHGLDQAAALARRIATEARGIYIIMPFGKNCFAETAAIVRLVRDAAK